MASGVVKWFNDAKGFGFIKSDDGQEVFVHHSEIASNRKQTLRDGQRVSFELTKGPRGLTATKVRERA